MTNGHHFVITASYGLSAVLALAIEVMRRQRRINSGHSAVQSHTVRVTSIKTALAPTSSGRRCWSNVVSSMGGWMT
jgi:hypothetical protein